MLAGDIINNWARPIIFNKSSDYDKEERQGRDVELVARKRHKSSPKLCKPRGTKFNNDK